MFRSRRGRKPLIAAAALLLVIAVWFVGGWYTSGPLAKEVAFRVPDGSSLSSVASKLEAEGIVSSASTFKLRARLLGGDSTIKAGEFALPPHASMSRVFDLLTGGEVLRRFVTVPEGMPSIMVYERLMANPLLTGEIAVPAEGSILPDTYELQQGESRQAVVNRMQAAMKKALAEEWKKRGSNAYVRSPQEAIILASIVEKETGKASERTMVAGLYSNRLREGMRLQADPTIIYPITKGKPLGRRILQSEIRAVNDYNTYSMAGLPKGPITNPGRDSIAAALNPADTDVLYMVADGSGGHAFATTLPEHNANVRKWFDFRKARGDF